MRSKVQNFTITCVVTCFLPWIHLPGEQTLQIISKYGRRVFNQVLDERGDLNDKWKTWNIINMENRHRWPTNVNTDCSSTYIRDWSTVQTSSWSLRLVKYFEKIHVSKHVSVYEVDTLCMLDDCHLVSVQVLECLDISLEFLKHSCMWLHSACASGMCIEILTSFNEKNPMNLLLLEHFRYKQPKGMEN